MEINGIEVTKNTVYKIPIRLRKFPFSSRLLKQEHFIQSDLCINNYRAAQKYMTKQIVKNSFRSPALYKSSTARLKTISHDFDNTSNDISKIKELLSIKKARNSVTSSDDLTKNMNTFNTRNCIEICGIQKRVFNKKFNEFISKTTVDIYPLKPTIFQNEKLKTATKNRRTLSQTLNFKPIKQSKSHKINIHFIKQLTKCQRIIKTSNLHTNRSDRENRLGDGILLPVIYPITKGSIIIKNKEGKNIQI